VAIKGMGKSPGSMQRKRVSGAIQTRFFKAKAPQRKGSNKRSELMLDAPWPKVRSSR
jgi:hypothetical protein